MKGRLSWPIFWALLGVFIVIVAIMVGSSLIPAAEDILGGGWFLVIAGILLLSLGIALLVLAAKEKGGGLTKKFLILTGASAAGIPVGVVLHNAVYGLFIYFFGADFWERNGVGDEPVFFIIAIIICPVAFLVGAAGNIVLAIKKR